MALKTTECSLMRRRKLERVLSTPSEGNKPQNIKHLKVSHWAFQKILQSISHLLKTLLPNIQVLLITIKLVSSLPVSPAILSPLKFHPGTVHLYSILLLKISQSIIIIASLSHSGKSTELKADGSQPSHDPLTGRSDLRKFLTFQYLSFLICKIAPL